MPRLPDGPLLRWLSDTLPADDRFGDVYHSGEGLSEKRLVFLEGCGLPQAFAGRERFTIGELGFGAGISFLAAWDCWRRNRPSPAAQLHFLSYECALLPPDDARRALAACSELAPLARMLASAWPVRARGVQRIAFPDGVRLTLFQDDAADAIEQTDAIVDAWFFDGFAPSRNPGMWNARVFSGAARLSAKGARAATYSVAGAVRRGLADAGFSWVRRPGFGRKNERLEAHFMGEGRSSPPPPGKLAVIGGGIAGAMTCRALTERGAEVTLFEAGENPGTGASGNPLALVTPRLDATDTPLSRLLVSAYLTAVSAYASLPDDCARITPVRLLPRSDAERVRFRRLMADPPLPPDLLAAISDADPGGGLQLATGVIVRPANCLRSLLAAAHQRTDSPVSRLIAAGDGVTIETASAGEIRFDAAVVCAGMGTQALTGISLEGRLGQVDSGPAPATDPFATMDGGYAASAFGTVVFGATFEPWAGEALTPSKAASAHNLAILGRLAPSLLGAIPPDPPARVSVRATTSDRLPALSLPAGSPTGSVSTIAGLGSRGFTWSPLLAEIVAARLMGEPLPAETGALRLIAWNRFAERAARRRQSP
jgi:tRNA 5-methylaminomethyl-2-thiouridine biosynthesis bifunctional protein